MFNFLRKIGKSNKLDNFQEVHSGDDFKILKANKKISLNVLKGEVKDFSPEQIKKISNDDGSKNVLQKHTTYFKSGNFIFELVPVKELKNFRMVLIDEKKISFNKGVMILSSTTDC